MKLFVGLGNPGGNHAAHRHNVGFMAVDAIASAHGFSSWRRRFQGVSADGVIGGEKLLLLKPATYMNESGRSVGEAVRFFKLELDDVIVFYDEIDLAPGRLKVKCGGGNAGHNGLRSISGLVGNEFWRVRIGIGRPVHKDLVAHYVLHDFAKVDHEWLQPLLAAIADCSAQLVKGDAARFLTDLSAMLRADDDSSGPPRPGRQGKGAAPDAAVPERGGGTDRAAEAAGKGREQPPNALAETLQKWLKGRKS